LLVGAIEVVPVFDAVGILARYSETYPDVAADEWTPYRALYPELFSGDSWRFPNTCHVVRSDGTTILVDTGIGPPGLWDYWTPETEGLLPSGLEPDEVDIVFHTHLHADHVGWNADADGAPLFPRARFVVHPDALEHRLSHPDSPLVQRCIAPLLDRFEDASDGMELAPGVTARALAGHYPGHMGLSIESEGARAEVIGDLAVHPALLDRPEWVFAFDEIEQTPTRARLVEEVLDTETLVACAHYPGTGIGRVVTRGERVVWEQV
jgi:glyoxylase-like metal-dependent hydrolase (beta-lactamase superfamily II)